MSTNFRIEKNIRMSDLFGGRLISCGIIEHLGSSVAEPARCLDDGRNYLWVFPRVNGTVESFSRYGLNDVSYIVESIVEEFETEVYSEYAPKYWGFNTQKEWDDKWEELNS